MNIRKTSWNRCQKKTKILLIIFDGLMTEFIAWRWEFVWRIPHRFDNYYNQNSNLPFGICQKVGFLSKHWVKGFFEKRHWVCCARCIGCNDRFYDIVRQVENRRSKLWNDQYNFRTYLRQKIVRGKCAKFFSGKCESEFNEHELVNRNKPIFWNNRLIYVGK